MSTLSISRITGLSTNCAVCILYNILFIIRNALLLSITATLFSKHKSSKAATQFFKGLHFHCQGTQRLPTGCHFILAVLCSQANDSTRFGGLAPKAFK